MGVVHWDEVEARRRAKGEMDATWQRLAAAAGARGVGVNRVRLAAGMLPTPPHSHGASEELFFVLGGDGLAWQDGTLHELRAGDCVVHRADELEHTFSAGPNGLDYLVFGTNHPTELGWLPRSSAVRFGWPWVEGRTDDPWDLEAQAGPLTLGEPAPGPEHRQPRRGRRGDRGGRGLARACRGGRVAGDRPQLATARSWPHGRSTALPFRGRGGVRHPRGRGRARAVADTGR